MGRRRLQQKGDLYIRGGEWKLRWKEDRLEADGSLKRGWSKSVRIGPATGEDRLTKKQAMRIAWEQYLSRADANNMAPRSVATLAQFVKTKYEPQHIAFLRKNTRQLYRGLLKNWILKYMGEMRLRDVRREHVQRLVSVMMHAGKSAQTVRHARNVLSSIFNLAEDYEWVRGNPASRVKLPAIVPAPRKALNREELDRLLVQLEEPYRTMARVLAHTGMRIGELVALKWKYVNLTDQPVIVGAEVVPSYAIAVRESFAAGEWASCKNRPSRRDIPMTATVWVELSQIFERKSLAPDGGLSQAEQPSGGSPSTTAASIDPESLVFPSRNGTPIDRHNFSNRQFADAAKKAGIPWATPHCLRHTAATFTDLAGMTMAERMKLLGHTAAQTTMRYTAFELESVRRKLEQSETIH